MNELGREVVVSKELGGQKKRGRKKKGEEEKYEVNKDRTKFFVDLSKESKDLTKVFMLLELANQKDFGREVTFKDIALLGLSKITVKEVENLKESSMSEMEKVERAWIKFNEKNGSNLSIGEFLTKKLSI